jgi:hypothetical protein
MKMAPRRGLTLIPGSLRKSDAALAKQIAALEAELSCPTDVEVRYG